MLSWMTGLFAGLLGLDELFKQYVEENLAAGYDVILEIEKNPTIHRDTKFIGKKPAATPTSIPTIITSDSSKPKNDGLKIVF